MRGARVISLPLPSPRLQLQVIRSLTRTWSPHHTSPNTSLFLCCVVTHQQPSPPQHQLRCWLLKESGVQFITSHHSSVTSVSFLQACRGRRARLSVTASQFKRRIPSGRYGEQLSTSFLNWLPLLLLRFSCVTQNAFEQKLLAAARERWV